jgi:hypothetical protein
MKQVEIPDKRTGRDGRTAENAKPIGLQRRSLDHRRSVVGKSTGWTAVCIYYRKVCDASPNRSGTGWTCGICRGKGVRYRRPA